MPCRPVEGKLVQTFVAELRDACLDDTGIARSLIRPTSGYTCAMTSVVTFPDGETLVRHIHGTDPPGVGNVVTMEKVPGLWLVQRSILKGFDDRFVEGQTVYATVVVGEAPSNAAHTADVQ